RVEFTPSIGGKTLPGRIGQALGHFRPVGSPSRMGGKLLYFYQFTYPDLNLNALRSADGLPS
ncbi:hypothetical protein, partial [Methylobacterium sp. P5_C11]